MRKSFLSARKSDQQDIFILKDCLGKVNGTRGISGGDVVFVDRTEFAGYNNPRCPDGMNYFDNEIAF